MLAILSRLLAVGAASALAWIIYQLTVICRRGAALARQFRGPPVRHMLTGADAIPPPPPPRCKAPPGTGWSDRCRALTAGTMGVGHCRSLCERGGAWSVWRGACALRTMVRHAGHVAEMTTHDTHKVLLSYVYQYGANFKIRLVYNHMVVITEVGPLSTCMED